MQLIVRGALIALAGVSTVAESAGRRPLGRAPSNPECGIQAAVCTVSTPVFSFGRQPMTGSTNPIYAQGSITVVCDKIIQQGILVTITFDLSGLPPADPRELASGQGELLDYNVYLDPTRTRVWGDGTKGTEAISDVIEMRGSARHESKTYLLYGRVNGGQPAATGNYLNSINAEMRYGVSCQ